MTLKGIDKYKYKNDGITSMLLFVAVMSIMDISSWKSLRLTTWSTQRVRDVREHENEPRSMFCVDIKYHWPLNDGYR